MEGVNAGARNSLREHVLIKAQKRKEDIEHIRFLTLLKIMQVDKTDSAQVLAANNLLNTYYDLIDPKRVIDRKKFTNKSEDTMESFNKYFVKLKEKTKTKTKENNPKSKAPTLKSFDRIE